MPAFARRAVLAVLLLSIGDVVVAQQAPETLEEQLAPYLAPQQLVPIAKGRTINLVCLGQGSPTVILSAGLSHWSVWWWQVQNPLARRTRVCAWDPAGYGFSTPSAQPQDVVHAVEDLEQTLKGAGIEGPYVMVGSSLGGYHTLRFTDLHRERVAGIVLVDPAIPDQYELFKRFAPKVAAIEDALTTQAMKRLRDCAAGLQGSTLKRGTPQFEQCTAYRSLPPFFSRVTEAMEQLNANPARLLTQASLQEHFALVPDDPRQVINPHRQYGDLPLIVLTGGRDTITTPPGTPGATTPDELAEFNKQVAQFLQEAWVPAHHAYAALSTRGRNQLVADSGHNIQVEKPEAVVGAIIEVLEEIHSPKPTFGAKVPR
jgi:pimeloyl-ACP methyl ester carboxylesterase